MPFKTVHLVIAVSLLSAAGLMASAASAYAQGSAVQATKKPAKKSGKPKPRVVTPRSDTGTAERSRSPVFEQHDARQGY